jgi:hypothetical protein
MTQSVFADSRILKQDTKQNANCDTVGTISTGSDSCGQRAANNVNNGVPRTAAVSGATTLFVSMVCNNNNPICANLPFAITVTGNNPLPSSFSITGSGSQLVTLGPGNFRIEMNSSFPPDFSGDCAEFSPEIATGYD